MRLTEDSKKLRDFCLSRIDNKSSKSLKDLYSFFKSIQLSPITRFNITPVESNNNRIKSEFVSKKIIQLSENLKKKTSILFTIRDINITIHIYHTEKEELKEFIINIINYIQFIISLVKSKKERIIINYYLINKKKSIKSRIPNKDEVNSGSCQCNEIESIINIWRKEEILKVTLHELIHALYFDKYKDTNDLINHYRIRYNVSSLIMNTNEAYTELWANLMNCYLISKNETNQEELFNTLVSLEKCFSNFQAHKIIYHTNISNNKNIVDINKNTSVIAYYIIRSELYNNLDGFLNHCSLDINNENYLKIKDSHSWILFLKSLKKITKNNRRFNKKNKDIQYKTIRMSLVELKVF